MSAPLRVLVMGDSNATDFNFSETGEPSWAKQISEVPGLIVTHKAKPGHTIGLGHTVAMNLSEAERRCDVVICAWGTVDVQRPWYHPRITTPPEFMGTLTCILDQFYFARAVICCPQLAPSQEPVHPFLIAYAHAVRKLVRCSALDVTIGAWHDVVKPTMFPPDDVHYDLDGHRLMSSEIRRAVWG